MFGNPDETLALVFEILHESLLMQGPKFYGLFMVNVLCLENKTWIFMVLNLMDGFMIFMAVNAL